MTSESLKVSPTVLAVREKMREGRERLAEQQREGALGVQLCRRMTSLFEEAILDLYQSALTVLWRDHSKSVVDSVCLVGHSGYGRGEMAPYSDVDLMILHTPQAQEAAAFLAKRLSGDVFDAGLQLGLSVRTIPQVLELAAKDAPTFTALIESRLLVGDEALFGKFISRFRSLAARNSRRLSESILFERNEERDKYGETVYLLRPNIKRSRGGLRDIQLVRWIGYTLYGEADTEMLSQTGAISTEDWQRLRDARETLLRLRNDLHFHAKRAQDTLDREEQVRIAELWQYQPTPGLLPVELFMRDYFRLTADVSDVVDHLLSRSRHRSPVGGFFGSLLSLSIEGDFRVGPSEIYPTSRGMERMRGSLSETMRLMDLAATYDKPIRESAWDEIRAGFRDSPLSRDSQMEPLATERFLSFLSHSAERLGSLLRQLHAIRGLDPFVPGIDHARCLIQFNDYHKYTVDEHSFRVVDSLTAQLAQKTSRGDAYRAVRSKRVLHLAAVLHDLGKGFDEDHSIVGERFALEAGEKLGLPEDERQSLAFLVRRHLLMSEIAQRRDISDLRVVASLARAVGTPDQLRMLYCLTCADLEAVGPGALSSWKLLLLTDLYNSTLQLLAAGEEAFSDQRLQSRRAEILTLALRRPDLDWWTDAVELLPANMLLMRPAQLVFGELARVKENPVGEVIAWARYLEDRQVTEYSIGASESICPGIFHRLTGALTGSGLQILSAEIHTLPLGFTLDRFWVQDGDYTDAPPETRLKSVCDALVASLKSPTEKPPTFRNVWRPTNRSSAADLAQADPEVRIDRVTSESNDVIAVFAYDQMGLLYKISRKLYDLGLSISLAKVGTHLDQVVDVFYVQDATSGGKLDSPRLAEIERELLETLKEPSLQPTGAN